MTSFMYLNIRVIKIQQSYPRLPHGIVACTFALFPDNLSRNSCIANRKSRCPCDPRGKHARFVRDEIINLAARRFGLSFARNWPMGVRCARFARARAPLKTVFESVCRIPIVIEASTKRIVYSQWPMTII